jgi:hypothetical protein
MSILNRLAKQLAPKNARLPINPQSSIPGAPAEVMSVSGTSVTVKYNGALVPLYFTGDAPPSVGSTIMALSVGNQMWSLGTLGPGAPTSAGSGSGSGSGSGILGIGAGTGISINDADPSYPIISAAAVTGSSIVFNVVTYGAVGNGTTDDTIAIRAAITAAVAAGGGIIWFPAGTYLVTDTLTLPVSSTASAITINEGSPTIYLSVPLRFTGVMDNKMPRGDAPTFGSIIKFQPSEASTFISEAPSGSFPPTYDYYSLFIGGLGEGSFEFDHLSVMDTSSDSNLFFFFNNTVPNIHDCYFYGNSAYRAAKTDVVQLGGFGPNTESQPNGGAANGIWQAQNGAIERNALTRMRHLAFVAMSGAGTRISDNNLYNGCGSNISSVGDAPIILSGNGWPITNIFIENNSLELGYFQEQGGPFVNNGYGYGIILQNASKCSLINNSMADVGPIGTSYPSFFAGYYFDSLSINNMIIEGERETWVPYAAGNVIGTNPDGFTNPGGFTQLSLRQVPQMIGQGGLVAGAMSSPYAADPPDSYPTVSGPSTMNNNQFFIQAGTQAVDTSIGRPNYSTINFPLEFPNGVLAVFAISNGASNEPDSGVNWVGQVFEITLSQFQFYWENVDGDLPTFLNVSWFAIGC